MQLVSRSAWGAVLFASLLGQIFLSASAFAQGVKQPPPQPATPIQIISATPNATTAPVYARVEIEINLQATYANPFDPNQIAVDANITPPSGQPVTLPGFYYQPFTQDLSTSTETLKPAGSPSWHVRLALNEPGVTKVIIVAKDKTGTAQSKEIDLTATPATRHGFIQVSEKDFHYFAFSDGAPFFPIGSTLLPHQGLIDLQTWLPALSSSGANTARLMLGPENTPFATNTKASGAYKVDLGNAWRLDQAMDQMDKDGINAILCMDNFNELRDRDFDPRWTTNPLNHDNGGPLFTNTEFWKSDVADQIYRNKIRYLVARYSAYANLIGWEFWRDLDLVHGYDPDDVRPWIDHHAQYIKSLDPYGHLVTVSFAAPLGERSIDHLPDIDFVQSHVYDTPDLVPEVTLEQYRKAGYGKPHVVTEVAANSTSDQAKKDTNGLQIHNPGWASIVSGAGGAAMPWWWDTYIFPRRMYNRFSPLAAFVKGIDWGNQNFRPTTPAFRFQEPPSEPIYQDLAIQDGPVSFDNTEYNLPRYVRIRNNAVQYGLPVSGVLQGQKRHPSKFNPITFTMDIKRPTEFDLMIGDVSGAGGAAIQVKLDGEIVLGLDLADPNDLEDTDTITKYHGTYSVQIPAGHHVLVVADVGNDWVMANYRFRDIFIRKTPPLIGYCLTGDSIAIAWIRQSDRSWDRIENQKRSVQTCPLTTMLLQNLIAGQWSEEQWDTWTGKVIKRTRITVGSDGTGTVNLPEISADIALKLIKVPVKTKPAKKQ